jgi:hypothetical protein
MNHDVTQEELQAEAARLDAKANAAEVFAPGSDAARIARLEAEVFVLQAGMIRTAGLFDQILRIEKARR